MEVNKLYTPHQFVIETNKFNLKKVVPVFERTKLSDEIINFALTEHLFITYQFNLLNKLLLNTKIKFNDVDNCLMVASITRSLIENLAVVYYFLNEDKTISQQDKIDYLNNYRNMADNWLSENPQYKKPRMEIKALDAFMQENKKVVNKNIWAGIDKKLQTTSNLIKEVFKNPPHWTKAINKEIRHKNYGDLIYDEWDSLSKLLHNSQFHRYVFLREFRTQIGLNYKIYRSYTSTAIDVLSVLIIDYMHRMIYLVGDNILINVYEKFVKKQHIAHQLKNYGYTV